MSEEDRYATEWEAERKRELSSPQEKKESRWALGLALSGFLVPFCVYQYLGLVVFRYDLGWWEGGGAIVFLLFAIVIFVFEAIAISLAWGSKRATNSKLALGFAGLSMAFVAWIVFHIILGLTGYFQ